MRMKQYAALFAFIAAFAMSAVAANFFKVESGTIVLRNKTQEAQKINEFLTQDIANGHESALSEDYVISTLNYVEDMESLDDSNLPSDFRRAWYAHKKAWQVQSDLIANAERYNSTDSLQRAWKRNNKEISRTWFKLLQVAQQHGAEIPAGAYD